MFSVSLSIIGTQRIRARAEAALRRVGPEMLAVARIGAAHEREHHAYMNRTGTLQRSTRGVYDARSADMVRVVIEMDTDYAKYIIARGLSSVREAVSFAREQMRARIRDIVREATSA